MANRGIQFDNTANGSLTIRGPETGFAKFQLPDMTGLTNQKLVLDSNGDFAFSPNTSDYVLPVASETTLGGVKAGSGVTIAGDGTLSVTATSSVTSVAGKTGDVTLTTTDISGLATVASSGSYNDLIDKPVIPTVPTNVSAFTNDVGYQTLTQVNSAIQAVVGAAPEALDTLQEIAAQLQADESAAAALTTTVAGKADITYVDAQLANKVDSSTLATVATSGLYSDLVGTPSLATVATSGLYSDLTGAPTNVSAFTNDAGYLTTAPVTSVAGKTGVVTLTSSDISGLATIATSGLYSDLTGAPTNVSAFTNDAGYLSSLPVASTTTLGGVKAGNGVSIAGDGTISVTGTLVSGSNGSTSVLASVTTTDATPVTAASFTLTDNTAILFTADVVAKTATGTTGAGFTIEGLVHRSSGAASTAFTGLPMVTIVARDNSGWDADAVVNTTTGSVEVSVTGSTGATLNWFANIRVTYVG